MVLPWVRGKDRASTFRSFPAIATTDQVQGLLMATPVGLSRPNIIYPEPDIDAPRDH